MQHAHRYAGIAAHLARPRAHAMTERLTLATAEGWPLLSLAFHVAMGSAALTAGLVAIVARKGGQWHRRAGMLFAVTMVAVGLTAVGISAYTGSANGIGALTAYLVITAVTTVRPLSAGRRATDVTLMLLAFTFAGITYQDAITALGRPNNRLDGVPAGMFLFLGTVTLLAAIGDLRMIRGRNLQGSRRIARHLWRMCFAVFMASSSFATQLVMMPFMPASLRSVPAILMLGGGPLVVMLYWLWRVRLRNNLRGLTLLSATARQTSGPPRPSRTSAPSPQVSHLL